MKFAEINKNDFINGEGVCVSLWMQGCPHHCKGCHNKNQWNFDGGQEINKKELINTILSSINANNIQRNFSLLGGEPLAQKNIIDALDILKEVKKAFPTIKTYVWTGYTLEELLVLYEKNIFENIDVLIDGKFILEERDITLKLRGSRNQRILYKGIDF